MLITQFSLETIEENKDDNSAHFHELKYILACNTFAFNCFPNGEYVPARHNLRHSDYMSYIEAIYSEMEKHEHPEAHLMPVSENPGSSETVQTISLDIDEWGPFMDFATEFGRFMDLKRNGKLEDFLQKTECTCDCGCGADHDAAAVRTSILQ
ncbi:unnamed protein product [Caenorhabditis brenneri]